MKATINCHTKEHIRKYREVVEFVLATVNNSRSRSPSFPFKAQQRQSREVPKRGGYVGRGLPRVRFHSFTYLANKPADEKLDGYNTAGCARSPPIAGPIMVPTALVPVIPKTSMKINEKARR